MEQQSKLPVCMALYIDLPFLNVQVDYVLKRYKAGRPWEEIPLMTLESMLVFIEKYLGIEKRYDVHLFGHQQSFASGVNLDCSGSGLCAIKEHQCNSDDIARAIAVHMRKDGKCYKEIILAADDKSYPMVMDQNRCIDVLLYCDDESTGMYMVNYSKWQNILYVIAFSMGLNLEDI